MQKSLFIAGIMLVALGGAPAWADDVTDQINEGLKAYEKSDLSTAAAALTAATNLIRQKQAKRLAAVLPEPLSGWTAKAADTEAAPMGLGSGIQARRVYKKGVAQVTVTIAGESPMLQAMSVMFSNPMFQSGESSLVIMDDRKVIQDKRKNALMTMIADKILVSAKGGLQTEAGDVKAYFNALDFDTLKKLVN